MNDIHVSVIIPMFNEAGCIAENAARISAFLDANCPSRYEMLLVNDGSTDDTGAISENMAANSGGRIRFIDNGRNHGKGHAVKTGMLAASGAIRLYTDADLAVPVSFFGECIRQIDGGAAVSIASRHLPGSSFAVPEGKIRSTLGGIYRHLTLKVFSLPVSDITCGLKGFSADAAASVFTRSIIERWGYDAEILFLAARMGLPIREFPVTWHHSFDSAVRVGTDSYRTFVEMFQMMRQYRSGKYRLP